MPVTIDHVRDILAGYLDAYPGERRSLEPIADLLAASADLTSRREFRGHATAGAVLVDREGQVLLIKHRALDRWLLPGGHLENDDASLLDAALRELTEETGIPSTSVDSLDDRPVHVDAHPIPANPAKGEPAHQHFDFRFLFRTSSAVGRLQTEEVTSSAWRHLDELPNEVLRDRIRIALD